MFRSFRAAAIFLEPNLYMKLDNDKLRTQFRLFHVKLKKMSVKMESLTIPGKFFQHNNI